MMGVTTVINCAGVDKEKFIDYTEKNPATYRQNKQIDLTERLLDKQIDK